MSVTFKCIVSGNTVTFEHEVDIVTTRANPAYEEVKEVIVEEEPLVIKKPTVKKQTPKSEE